MNGMNQDDVDGATRVGVPNVMQRSLSAIMPPGEIAAMGTAEFFSIAGTLLEEGRRKVMRIIDTCGGGGHISTGTGHREIFREFKHNKGIMAIFQICVKRNCTTGMLHSQKTEVIPQRTQRKAENSPTALHRCHPPVTMAW
jgi:hypothetical protein